MSQKSRFGVVSRLMCLSWAVVLVEAGSEDLLLYSRPETGVVVRTEFSEDRVLFSQGPHVAPRISPDATRILFNSVEGDGMGVWLANRDGEDRLRVCDGAQAAWSPDGTKVLLQRDGRLVERDLASSEETVVSPDDAPRLAYPSYLAGGRIVCTDEAGQCMYLIAAKRDRPLEMLLQGDVRSGPRGSPDGRSLAYQDGTHLYVMDLDSRAVRQLTFEPGVQACPVWSSDGQGLCYAAESSPSAGDWEVHYVALAKPYEVQRIERRVYPSFDWSGSAPWPMRTETLPDETLVVWRGDTPLDPARVGDMHTQAGWDTVGDYPLIVAPPEQVAVENHWFVLGVSPEGIQLAPKGEGIPPVELRIAGQEDGQGGKVSEIRVTKDFDDRVVVQVTLSGEVAATIQVSRARPLVELLSSNQVGRVDVQSDMALVVVPDRHADDLVLTPEQAAPGAVVALPQTPMALGCLSGSGAMLMVVAPSAGQSLALSRGDANDRWAGFRAVPAGQPVVLALCAADRVWERLEVAQDSGRGAWNAAWERPAFRAAWRLAVRGKDAAYSRTWNTRHLDALGGGPLPIEGAFVEQPETAVVYAWGRDAFTPLNVWTPEDLLLDALGLDGYQRTLDVEGIQGYRSGDGNTPFRELTAHNQDWHPAKANDDQGPFGVLEVMGSVFPTGTNGVRSLLTHLGDDAVNLLQGLDARVQEYEQFLGELKGFCASNLGGRGQDFLESLMAQGGAALERGRGARKTDITRVKDALKDLLGIVGTRDQITLEALTAYSQLPGNEDWAEALENFAMFLAAQEGRLWHGGVLCHEVWYEDEFKVFSRLCRRILAERQGILAEYRALAKRVSDETGRRIVSDPDFKPIGDEIRTRTRDILRNRYYLEGDWRGETPLTDGESQ